MKVREKRECTCKCATKDEFFRWCQDFRNFAVADGEGGRIETWEFGDRFFLSLDALGVWPSRLAWCECSWMMFRYRRFFGGATRGDQSSCHDGLVGGFDSVRDEY